MSDSTDGTRLDVAHQWAVAEKETRDAAKWFIVTLGAVAVAIFGAGPVFLTSTYSLPTDWAIVAVQAAAATIALLSIAYLVKEISHLLAPLKVNLQWIASRPTLEERFNRSPDLWYPTGVKTIAQLRKELVELRGGLGKLQSGVTYNESRISELERISNLGNDPSPTPEMEAAKTALSQQRQYLPAFERSYTIARQCEQRIVAEAALSTLQQRFLGGRGIKVATAAAIVFSVIFVTSLSLQPPSSAPPEAKLEVANLVAASTPEAAQLWNLLGLGSCESNGQVPVVILEDNGSDLTVETIPWTQQCESKSITITDSLGSIVKRSPISVSVTTVTVATAPPP